MRYIFLPFYKSYLSIGLVTMIILSALATFTDEFELSPLTFLSGIISAVALGVIWTRVYYLRKKKKQFWKYLDTLEQREIDELIDEYYLAIKYREKKMEKSSKKK